MEPRVLKQTDQQSVYFSIYWSRLVKADKYDIIRKVPSVPGVFELYFQDEKKKLNLFFLSKAFYGGLLNTIRKHTDPELEDDPARKKILNTCTIYYRYTVTYSFKDMTDIIFFFKRTYFPSKTDIESSGRYLHIFINEYSDDKIVTI